MIPKVIYMCYKDIKILELYSNNWKNLNPEYEIKLYDDLLCKKFLLEEYSKLYSDIFDFIPDGPIKADFWRICVLYKYGGVYIDADIEPLISLNNYIEDSVDFVTCLSDNNNCYNPHFIMANANDNILKQCIDKYLLLYNNKIDYSYWGWSIVYIFNDVLKFDINNSNEGIYYIDNKKYQFLKESHNINKVYVINGRKIILDNFIQQPFMYNKLKVFNNKYITYKDHKFV